MITVYQNPAIMNLGSEVNRLGWDEAISTYPEVEAHCETAHSFGDKVKWKTEWFKFYDAVAKVESDNLEETFRITNLWNEPDRVEKLKEMRSLSVGDILEDDTGEYFMVAGFGFTKIEV